jgi:hypothetical protein
MCCVVVETHVHKNTPSQSLEGWGLIDGDEFILIWSKHRAVWDEVGMNGTPITLTKSEVDSVSHACGHEPEEVQVALAKYRLTGEVEPLCSE